MKQSSESMTVTRATSRGVPPPTIYAKKSTYYNSFLPKTVREFKSKEELEEVREEEIRGLDFYYHAHYHVN